MTDTPDTNPAPAAAPPGPRSELERLRTRLFGAVVIVSGLAVAGGVHLAHAQRDAALATPLTPTTVASLRVSDAVAVKGDVAEIFGNKLILQDATGRALVDTGPRGDDAPLATKGETLQAQGRFEHGVLHAAVLVHADGRRVVLGPPGPLPPLGADPAALTERVRSAGYRDIRIVGHGPRHLDVVARTPDGKDRDLHVDVDGPIQERGEP